ncbi:hypothetical protein ACFL12_02315 [Pseudomonadota bacterium]
MTPVCTKPVCTFVTSAGLLRPLGPTQLGLNAQAQAYRDMLSGLRMDEHGNWFDQHGNRIENPHQNENIQTVDVYEPWAGELLLDGLNWIENQFDGTAKKQAEKAEKEAEKEKADRARAIRALEKQFPGYTHNGNNFNAPHNNTMTEKRKEQVIKEVGTIAGQKLVGGTMKIFGARPGKKPAQNPRQKPGQATDNTRNLLNNGLDAIGDKVLEGAKKNEERWDYPEREWHYLK